MRSLILAAAALSCLATVTYAADPTAVPDLSGPYSFTNVENCSNGSFAQSTGTIIFNFAARTFVQAGFRISGTPPTETFLNSVTGTYAISYTSPVTSLSLSSGGTSTTYRIFYGASSSGIAEYATGIQLAPGPCSELLTLTRQ